MALQIAERQHELREVSFNEMRRWQWMRHDHDIELWHTYVCLFKYIYICVRVCVCELYIYIYKYIFCWMQSDKCWFWFAWCRDEYRESTRQEHSKFPLTKPCHGTRCIRCIDRLTLSSGLFIHDQFGTQMFIVTRLNPFFPGSPGRECKEDVYSFSHNHGSVENYPKNERKLIFPLPWLSRWWFQIFFIFTPSWGRFPIWLIFFRWRVETTNQLWEAIGPVCWVSLPHVADGMEDH